jgi:hypothetical protein
MMGKVCDVQKSANVSVRVGAVNGEIR